MATPKGYLMASAGAATILNIASIVAGGGFNASTGGLAVATSADNFVIRVETGSARWLDSGPQSLPSTPTGGMGLPLFAGDGPIRVGPLAQINLLAAGVVHIQGYQGFFVL